MKTNLTWARVIPVRILAGLTSPGHYEKISWTERSLSIQCYMWHCHRTKCWICTAMQLQCRFTKFISRNQAECNSLLSLFACSFWLPLPGAESLSWGSPVRRKKMPFAGPFFLWASFGQSVLHPYASWCIPAPDLFWGFGSTLVRTRRILYTVYIYSIVFFRCTRKHKKLLTSVSHWNIKWIGLLIL